MRIMRGWTAIGWRPIAIRWRRSLLGQSVKPHSSILLEPNSKLYSPVSEHAQTAQRSFLISVLQSLTPACTGWNPHETMSILAHVHDPECCLSSATEPTEGNSPIHCWHS